MAKRYVTGARTRDMAVVPILQILSASTECSGESREPYGPPNS